MTDDAARDAALREEGRMQGLREAVKWCEAEQSVWAAQVGAYAKGSRNALVAKVRENAMKGAAAELRLLASTPDASQGSAPVCACGGVGAQPLTGPGAWRCQRCFAALAPPAAPQGSPLPGGATRDKQIATWLRSYEMCDWIRDSTKDGERRGVALTTLSLLADKLEGFATTLPDLPRNPPEGGALEGEMAEALRSLVFNNRCSRLLCDEHCRCDIGRGKRALARYDASKAIPQAWEPVFKRGERVAQRGVFHGTVIATSPTHFIVRYDEERFGTIEYSNAAAFHFGHIPQSGDEKEGTDGK